jgi:hypothetical protein
MRERAKVFTYISGTGSTVIETTLEDHLNQWLSSVDGEVVEITQSESTRDGGGHHVTVCIWYMPRSAD